MSVFSNTITGSGDSGRGSSVGSTPPLAAAPASPEGGIFDDLSDAAQDAYDRTADVARYVGTQASQYGDAARSGISNTIANARQASANTLDESQQMLAKLGITNSGAESFGSSLMNTIMGADLFSKLLFLVVVVITFLVLVSVGAAIISGITTYSKSPTVLGNLKSGTESLVIPQDPATANSIPLLRSKNQGPGIEFTYSTWIYVDELPPPSSLPAPTKFKHVFHKGAAGTFTSDGLSQPVNSPGLYIASDAADNGRQSVSLYVVMSTFDDPMESLEIHNIPLDMWINVVIVVKGQMLDVYINGTIAGRRVLQGVPMQSYGPLNMSLNGGFTGNMSTTRYYAYALSPVQIAGIASSAPSLKEKSGGLANPFPPYLSLRWYTGSSAI
jgi:hypothetical protein